jgi:RimJ/RimL family protein N-acetyltransferase
MMTLPLTSPLGPTIETKRLILRPPVTEDFEGFCAFFADEATMTHLGGVQSPATVWRTLRMVAGGWALDGHHMFSVIEKASGAWIGRIGPQYPHLWPDREVGWGLLSAYWGNGYALEAAMASMDYAFDHLGWDLAVHTIASDNRGSLALAKRLGSSYMRRQNLPDPFANLDLEVWGQTSAEWITNREPLLG